jgi:hypothetical protein
MPLKIKAIHANGSERQAYEVRKKLQELKANVALLSETHLKSHMRFYRVFCDIWARFQEHLLEVHLSKSCRFSQSHDSIRIMRQKNMVKGPAGPETMNDCASKGQQQFT